MPIEPDERQLQELAALAAGDADGPCVMLNLNRYRERAAYQEPVPGGLEAEVSGREAYARYGVVALKVLERVGGHVRWHAPASRTVIGDESDVYDEVIAAWYPSAGAFLALASDPELLAARAHRVAAMERAAIVCCPDG